MIRGEIKMLPVNPSEFVECARCQDTGHITGWDNKGAFHHACLCPKGKEWTKLNKEET